MIDDYERFFEKFGNLNSVEIRRTKVDDLIHYGLVEFETREGAAKLLSNALLRIGDIDFRVQRSQTPEADIYEKSPIIGHVDNFFSEMNRPYTTVYFTNYNHPIRTLYIAPINVDVSIPVCNVL